MSDFLARLDDQKPFVVPRPVQQVAQEPETAAQHLELLRSMLAGYPEIPPSFDGWYVFEKR